MTSRTTLLAVVSVPIGALLGAMAMRLYVDRYEQGVVGGAPVAVVMATRDLALGDLITRAALDVRELPDRYVDERHIHASDLEQVLGTRATSDIASGSTLVWSDLDVSRERQMLSALVRAGMRAFTLPERDVSFEGLLRPGDRVDVLFTPTAASAATVTLLEGALVLTVGSDLGDQAPREVRSGESGRVTLSVTVEQAQRLAHSERRGSFRLALRNPHDHALGGAATASSTEPQPIPRSEAAGGEP